MADVNVAAGSLRHSITILSPSSIQNEYGEPISTWIPVLTTRASIVSTQQNTYKAKVQDNSITSQATDIITIRYPGDSVTIQPGYRVMFGCETWDIDAIANVLHRNRVVKLYCIAIDEVG